MNTVRELLRDANPIRHEPHRHAEERNRLRQAVVAAASDVTAPLPAYVTFTPRPVGHCHLGHHFDPGRRLSDLATRRRQSPGGRSIRSAPCGKCPGGWPPRGASIWHRPRGLPFIRTSSSPIATSRGAESSRATARHDSASAWSSGRQAAKRCAGPQRTILGRPLAILIDGEVVTAPVVRGPISTSALISGDYTRAEAERIVEGIGIR